MGKHARKAATLTTKRPKTKGKKPSKREQAQMLALNDLGLGTYEIGAIMHRSPHTIRKYCQSPMFTDPKFQQLVEEYKEKELIDLTALNIESRARIHDLIPTMTPIEAIALMDKSFTQRRLLEGKSTENISSLRRIITEAHEVQNATSTRKEPSGNQLEHSNRDSSRQTAEAGSGNRVKHSSSEEEEAQIVSE